MIKIISRHIFSHVFFSVLMLTGILVMGAWLTQSLRFVEIIIERDISVAKYFSMIYLLLPSLTATVLPICAMLAAVYTLNKLIHDNEIVIYKSCGFSNWQISLPILLNGFLAFLFCGFLGHYLAPKASDQFNIMRSEVARDFSVSFVREGVFNKLKNTVIFVSEYGQNNMLKGVYVQGYPGKTKKKNADKDDTDFDEPLAGSASSNFIIFAQSGYLVHQDDKNILYLYDGCRQEIDSTKQKQSIFYFDQLKYDIDLHQGGTKKRKKQHRVTFWEMINPPATFKSHTKTKLFIEANKRIINPLFILIFTLFSCAIMLTGQTQRRGRWKKPLIIVSSALALHISILTLLNSYAKHPKAILLCYIILTILMLVSLVVLLKEDWMNRCLSQWHARWGDRKILIGKEDHV